MVSTLRTMKTSITGAPNTPGVTLNDTASEAPEKSPSCGVEKRPAQAFRSITFNNCEPAAGHPDDDRSRCPCGIKGAGAHRMCGHRIAASPAPTPITRRADRLFFSEAEDGIRDCRPPTDELQRQRSAPIDRRLVDLDTAPDQQPLHVAIGHAE